MTMTKKEAWIARDKGMHELAEAQYTLHDPRVPESCIKATEVFDGVKVGVFVVVGESRVDHINAILDNPFAGSVMQPAFDDGTGNLAVNERPRPQDFDFDDEKYVAALFAWRDGQMLWRNSH